MLMFGACVDLFCRSFIDAVFTSGRAEPVFLFLTGRTSVPFLWLTGIFIFILLLILFVVQQWRISVLNRLKRLQAEQIVADANYLNLFNNMPVVYMQMRVVTDESGTPVELVYCDVNSRFEHTFLPKSNVLGHKLSEMYPEGMPEFLHFVKLAFQEKRSITFPFYNRRIDTFFEVVLCNSNLPGMIDVFCLDSTELHRSQQKLSATNRKLALSLEVANIVPWKWNLAEKTILCNVNRPIELSDSLNEVDEKMLAVPDERYFSKICKEDRERVLLAYRELMEGNLERVQEEYRVISKTPDGLRTDWVEARAAVESRDEAGKPLTLVGSSLVINERKILEQELLSAKDRAEESNRLKSAFLANMSHEIRTPLNAIVGFSNILATVDQEQEKQEYVSIIEDNNALLLQLISDILDLSKIESGTLDFVYSDLELNGLMGEIEGLMRQRVKLPDVMLMFEPKVQECFVRMERNRLSQVLCNLLSNAIKFTTRGVIRFGYEQRGELLYFYVSDTGCGIPKEKHEAVFGRFVKLNTFEQGTGLGLSICQVIVQMMKGEIGLDSAVGLGSTFWFTLPFEPGAATAGEPELLRSVPVERDKLTILVAEDHASNYKLFESILKRDYRLVHAWDGKEAVELFAEYRPHLVLMDINMPVMDGYEATREIRKLCENTPIIAVTAFAYASDEQRVMNSGFDGFMPKPIDAGVLKTRITDMLHGRVTPV